MKISFNKSTLRCGLTLLMGLFFLAFGLMKVPGLLSGDPMLTDMVKGIFPFSDMIVLLLAWGVTLTEVVGGALVLAKKWAPKMLVKLSLVGFFVITLVGTVGIHLPTMNWGGLGMHVAILVILGWLLYDGCKK